MKKYYWILGLAAMVMTGCGGNKSESENYDESMEDENNIEVIDSYKETSEDLSNGAEIEEAAIDSEDDTNVKSAKIDEKLSQLKNIVEECADIISKAKSGNVDITKITSLVSQGENLKSELEGLKDEMTSAQLGTLNQLVSKLSNDAAQLAGLNASAAVDAAKEATKEKAGEIMDKAKDKGKEALKKIGF